MDPDERLLELLLLLALLLASGYFVAAEFAVLTLRRRKVEEIARDAAATRNAAPPTEDLSLAAQLGSSATALVLGYVAAQYALSTLTRVPPAVAVLIGLLLATLLHLVVGEQIPRLLGSQRAAWIGSGPALLPLRVLSLLLRPLIAVLSSALEAISRSLQLSRSTLYSPVYTLEDIRSLVTSGHQQGVVEVEEREMIDAVLELSETVAREVMTPRIDIVAVPLEVDLERLVQLVVAEGHSRLPVYKNSIDNIVGVLLAKDLLPLLTHGAEFDDATFDVARLMREPFFVPDTKPISEILGEFRRTSVHLAIVLDEFGGTYGLVTLEDLLEEIVGEIRDEHDLEEPEFARTPDGDVLIDGGASISEVNERFGLHIPEEDFDTIGGYIFGALGRVPEPGDRVEGVGDDPGVALDVEETEDRRITRVRLRRTGSVVAPER